MKKRETDYWVTQFRWVEPGHESIRSFVVHDDPDTIREWERRFDNWKVHLDQLPKDSKRRRLGMIEYMACRRNEKRTVLIEERMGKIG